MYNYLRKTSSFKCFDALNYSQHNVILNIVLLFSIEVLPFFVVFIFSRGFYVVNECSLISAMIGVDE